MTHRSVNNPDQNQEPLVSVLVPSYNHEKYIIECLESIKNLTYSRLEIIISDDCSRDSTFALAEEWAKRNASRFVRALVIRQEKNVGLVGNLQFLYNSAQGDYLAHIASDDLFVESAIEGRVQMFQNDRNIDGIFGNAQQISADGTLIRNECIPKWIARELSSNKLLVSSLVLHFSAPGPAMMLRREAVLEKGSLGPLPINLRIEDLYIYLRLASGGKLRFVDAIVAKYRAVPGSMNWTFSSVRLEEAIKTYELIGPLLSGFNRFVLENRIARFKLELNKGKVVFYSVRVFTLRCVLMLERTIVFTFALAHGRLRNWRYS